MQRSRRLLFGFTDLSQKVFVIKLHHKDKSLFRIEHLICLEFKMSAHELTFHKFENLTALKSN